MKVEAKANPFCPDDCPHFENETIVNVAYYDVDEESISYEHYCKNRDICKYAYELGRKAATDEIAGGQR